MATILQCLFVFHQIIQLVKNIIVRKRPDVSIEQINNIQEHVFTVIGFTFVGRCSDVKNEPKVTTTSTPMVSTSTTTNRSTTDVFDQHINITLIIVASILGLALICCVVILIVCRRKIVSRRTRDEDSEDHAGK